MGLRRESWGKLLTANASIAFLKEGMMRTGADIPVQEAGLELEGGGGAACRP